MFKLNYNTQCVSHNSHKCVEKVMERVKSIKEETAFQFKFNSNKTLNAPKSLKTAASCIPNSKCKLSTQWQSNVFVENHNEIPILKKMWDIFHEKFVNTLLAQPVSFCLEFYSQISNHENLNLKENENGNEK